MNACSPARGAILALALAHGQPVAAEAGVRGPVSPVRASPESRAERLELATGKFLVASRQLGDPNFAQTVVLLVEYDEAGAVGLIVNRPTRVPLAEALPDVPGLAGRDDRLYAGGPVARGQLMLLIRSRQPPPHAVEVLDDVHVSASLDTLRTLVDAGGAGPPFHAYAGYAGWAPGQLDGEVLRGDWRIWQAESSLVFDLDADAVWPTLIERSAGRWVRAPPAPGTRRGPAVALR